MKLRFFSALALTVTLSSALACSAGGGDDSTTNPGSGNQGTGASSSVGAQPSLGGGVGSGAQPSLGGSVGTSPLPMDPNDPRNVPVRPKICDANGKCTCLRLAVVGTLESAATSTDTKPFVDWLNGNSEGSATVTMVATKPTIDEAFLNMYDILVIANVNGWTFSADEKAAVEKWVKELGGGIVTLTGFNSMPAEPAATSQLVDFAGMGYTGSSDADYTAPVAGGSTPIHYHSGAQDLRNCLNLWSTDQDKQAAITTAIKFTPQTGSLEKLTASLDYVGAFIGWPVKAPAGSTVVATDPSTSKNIAVAYEVDGKGRILSFGDEWVIFTNQWQPVGNFTDARMDAGNMCWQAEPAPGFYHSVKSLYQTKQFWYNAINWVAPPSECNFTIRDDDVVVK